MERSTQQHKKKGRAFEKEEGGKDVQRPRCFRKWRKTGMTRIYGWRKVAWEDHEKDRNTVYLVTQYSLSHVKEFGVHFNCKKSPWREVSMEMSLSVWHFEKISFMLCRNGYEENNSNDSKRLWLNQARGQRWPGFTWWWNRGRKGKFKMNCEDRTWVRSLVMELRSYMPWGN